uniref:Uncharacterized protein n=1 Tax=Lepeophtheirus salmonis TaxID=72036 RepID=A0A0K2TCV6_LEPSM
MTSPKCIRRQVFTAAQIGTVEVGELGVSLFSSSRRFRELSYRNKTSEGTGAPKQSPQHGELISFDTSQFKISEEFLRSSENNLTLRDMSETMFFLPA